MKLIAAIEYDKLREDASSWNKVVLHKDGKFYHAYEWSAWLVKQFVCTEEFQKERGDEKMLQVARYKAKEHEYVTTGFPVESLSKYVPKYISVTPIEDSQDLVIEVELPLDGDERYEQLKEQFEAWKATCPERDTKRSKSGSPQPREQAQVMARSGLFGIVAQVLAYPVENSTPTQNIEFLTRLRQQVAALL